MVDGLVLNTGIVHSSKFLERRSLISVSVWTGGVVVSEGNCKLVCDRDAWMISLVAGCFMFKYPKPVMDSAQVDGRAEQNTEP